MSKKRTVLAALLWFGLLVPAPAYGQGLSPETRPNGPPGSCPDQYHPYPAGGGGLSEEIDVNDNGWICMQRRFNEIRIVDDTI